MASLWQDLRMPSSSVLSPGLMHHVHLTLALGIGGQTPAIFQLIDSVRLRTVPVKNPQELGTSGLPIAIGGSGQFSSQYSKLTFAMLGADPQAARKEFANRRLVRPAIQSGHRRGSPQRKGNPGRRRSFGVLGVEPMLGRLPWSGGRPARLRRVGSKHQLRVLAADFAGDPSIVAKRLTLDGNSSKFSALHRRFQWHLRGRYVEWQCPLRRPILSPRTTPDARHAGGLPLSAA